MKAYICEECGGYDDEHFTCVKCSTVVCSKYCSSAQIESGTCGACTPRAILQAERVLERSLLFLKDVSKEDPKVKDLLRRARMRGYLRLVR